MSPHKKQVMLYTKTYTQSCEHKILLITMKIHTKQGSISVSRDGAFCSTDLKQISVASPYFP